MRDERKICRSRSLQRERERVDICKGNELKKSDTSIKEVKLSSEDNERMRNGMMKRRLNCRLAIREEKVGA